MCIIKQENTGVVDGKDNKAKEDGSKRSPYILYTKVNNLSTDVKDLYVGYAKYKLCNYSGNGSGNAHRGAARGLTRGSVEIQIT